MVLKLETIGTGDFQSRLLTAASTSADGSIIDCSFYTGTQTITKTIPVTKSLTFVFGNITINGTLGPDQHMFHIQVPNVKFEGAFETGMIASTTTTSVTGNSIIPKLVMTQKGSGYHFFCSHTAKSGSTYNWASAGGFCLNNLELIGITSVYTLDNSGAPIYSIPGAGGVFITEGNPNASGSNIANVRISNITITNSRFHGILLYGAITSSIVNSRITGATGHGVFIAGSSTSVEIDTCKASNCGFSGFLHYQSTYSTLRNCISEQNGLGYWLRSSNNITLDSCGAENNIVKPTAPANFGITLVTSTSNNITLSDIGSDYTLYIKGTSFFTSGGAYNTHVSCYSKNPGNNSLEYSNKRTTHFGFIGGAEKCKVLSPGIYGTSVVKYKYRIESLGLDSPTDLLINSVVETYDPLNPTESPDNVTQSTATVLDQGSNNVFKIAVDKKSFESTDFELVKSDAIALVDKRKISDMLIVPAFSSEPSLAFEWSGAIYFNTLNNTLYMRDDGVWYSTCCTPPTPANPTPIVLPPYSTPISLTPNGPVLPPGGGTGSSGGTTSGGTSPSSGNSSGSGSTLLTGCDLSYTVGDLQLSTYSIGLTAYDNCILGVDFYTGASLNSADSNYAEQLALLNTLQGSTYNVTFVEPDVNLNTSAVNPIDSLGLPIVVGMTAYDVNSYDPSSYPSYTSVVPDGFYTIYLNPTWGGYWFQVVNGIVVTVGNCSLGLGAGVSITGAAGNTSILPNTQGGQIGSSSCVPSPNPANCEFPAASVNFICNANNGLVSPYSVFETNTAIAVSGNYIYYLTKSGGEFSGNNYTNFNTINSNISGVNTQFSQGIFRYNKATSVNELIYSSSTLNSEGSPNAIVYYDNKLYVGRSGGVLTGDQTTFDADPAIRYYDTVTSSFVYADYASSLDDTDTNFYPVDYIAHLGAIIIHTALNTQTGHYYIIVRDAITLAYISHVKWEYTPGSGVALPLSRFSVPSLGITNSSKGYFYDFINDRILLNCYLPASDNPLTPPAGVLSYVCTTSRIMHISVSDGNDYDYIDVNNLFFDSCREGVKFASINGEDYIYVLDTLNSVVSALDPNDGYAIINEWQLEDAALNLGEFKTTSFVLRKTASDKIICYYIVKANTVAASCTGSDSRFKEIHIMRTTLNANGTIGTLYGGYVNAPCGYPGENPELYLTDDDPEMLYVAGDTIFKMCNLVNGE